MTFKFPSAFLAPLAIYCNSSGLSKHVDDDNMLLTQQKYIPVSFWQTYPDRVNQLYSLIPFVYQFNPGEKCGYRLELIYLSL